jgi:hypothetical protein
MRRGPKGEKRPADAIGNAVHVMRIATGEIEEAIPESGKDPAAKALGKKGGTARVPGPWWFEVRKTLIVNERCGRLAENDTAAFRLSRLGVREVEVMTLARRQRRL